MTGIRIETTIDIAAMPDEVWRVLIDFPAYGQWNPFMDRVEGTPEVGARLVVHMTSGGKRGMTFKPTVTAVAPDRELRWLGRLGFGGLFDGEHYFALAPLPGGGTRLTHGETFSGVLVAIMKRATSGAHDGFDAFNEALRERAELLSVARPA